MSIGYPDYARLSLAGGFELFNFNGTMVNGTTPFSGYVGEWPYLNVFTEFPLTSDAGLIQFTYFTDDTFTSQVGIRNLVRGNGSFATTQYANFSPFVQVDFFTKSLNPIPGVEFSIYGTTGPSGNFGLASNDTPILSVNQSIGASTSVSFPAGHIQPGAGTLLISTAATSWSVNIQFYQWSSGTYFNYGQLTSAIAAKGGSFDVPLLDAPCQLFITNGDAAARSFIVVWMSK